ERALTLEHLDLDSRLIIAVGREDLRFARGDRGVARDHRRSYSARGFDGEGERRYVKEEHVFHVALEHATLDGRAHGYDFVRVHTFVRLFADQLARGLDDLRHARHATDEHQLVDVLLGELRVGQAILDRLDGALEKRIGQLLELRARELLLDMLRSTRVRRDEGQIDFVF